MSGVQVEVLPSPGGFGVFLTGAASNEPSRAPSPAPEPARSPPWPTRASSSGGAEPTQLATPGATLHTPSVRSSPGTAGTRPPYRTAALAHSPQPLVERREPVTPSAVLALQRPPSVAPADAADLAARLSRAVRFYDDEVHAHAISLLALRAELHALSLIHI